MVKPDAQHVNNLSSCSTMEDVGLSIVSRIISIEIDANNVKLDSISIKVYALKTTLFVRDIPSQKPHKFAHNALMIIIF